MIGRPIIFPVALILSELIYVYKVFSVKDTPFYFMFLLFFLYIKKTTHAFTYTAFPGPKKEKEKEKKSFSWVDMF